MPKVPVIMWESHTGLFTGSLVADGDRAAVGESPAMVLRQVKDYLEWTWDREPWMIETDFQEVDVVDVEVSIRPEYQMENRSYPVNQMVKLKLPCVCVKESGGMWVAALPTLRIEFNFSERKEVNTLAAHYIQSHLGGLTPAQLAMFLQPKRTWIEMVFVRSESKAYETADHFDPSIYESLNTVADPLIAGRRGRRRPPPAYERAAEVAQLSELLTNERASVLLVGDAGGGKSTLLNEAARKAARKLTLRKSDEEAEEEDDELPGQARYRFWVTNAARLIAGMRYLGEWQERCEAVIAELEDIGAILCLENLLDVVRVGGRGPTDSVAAFLLPYLQRGEIRVVAEVTPDELDTCRRLLPGLADVFQVLQLPAFSQDAANNVLQKFADSQATGRPVEFDARVCPLIYRLHERFQPYQGFPGAAVQFIRDLVDEALRRERRQIVVDDVLDRFSRQTGLPEVFLRDELPLSLESVREDLKQKIIAQDKACDTVAKVVVQFKAGLNDPRRPLGVLLFCGPTGVGKTALANTLAKTLFGREAEESRLVRLDMSEYGDYGAALRLMRAPDGKPSDFIRRVRHQPFTVVLLDEIEKAAPEVFDVFLNVFDEGRLADPMGRTTTFRSTVIIMTSNLGVRSGGDLGFGGGDDPGYESAAMKFFRPEFFNRIDSVVQFQHLERESILQITRKELDELAQREGLISRRIQIEWSDRLIESLADEGYDHRFGARPLQRAIETRATAALSKFVITHELKPGQKLRVDLDARGHFKIRIS